jgi:hypothetical protein
MLHRSQRVGVIGLAVAGAFTYRLLRPVPVSSQATPEYTAQFRIWVGMKDTEPKEWSGKVSATGANVVLLKGVRFSQQDRAANDGTFQFLTKMGNLENQLLTAHPYGVTDWDDPATQRLIPEGLIVQVRGSEAVRLAFDSAAGSFTVDTTDLRLGERASALDGNAMVERLPVEHKLSGSDAAADFPAMALAPDGALWVAWTDYHDKADEVLVSGAGRIHKVSGRGDHFAPTIAVDSSGRVHVIYSRKEGDTYQIYETVYTRGNWSRPAQLTRGTGSNLWPRLAAGRSDHLALTWQGLHNNESAVFLKLWDGRRWSDEQRVSESGSNAWAPSLAYQAEKLWVVWDTYASGSYQIYARQLGGPLMRVTRGEDFCVRPSIAVLDGAPVVAWEESDPLWGKDFAYLTDRRGTVLYKNRRIRVARLEAGSEWRELSARVEAALPPEIRRYVQQPQLASDGSRLFMALRARTSANVSRIDYWSNVGRWETFVTSLGGNGWEPAIPMPSSVGRNSMRSAIALDAREAKVVWATDNRVWPGVRYGDLEIYSAGIPLREAPMQIATGPMEATVASAANPHPNEREDTRRIRAYRYALNGKTYRILRGDLHRHTELSGDGAGDGMLDDLYRYELDAVAFDYAFVSDHQMGQDEEYNWWITQKSNDLYYMPQRFVPMYGYERSVPYPNGHRNVIWAERGQPVLRIGPDENKGADNSGPILYPYLRATKGITTAHTSATQQGTDWRDNAPDLEPFVEIYQGYEANYEHEGAPRSSTPETAKAHQGMRPAGYVWNAWAKGYKLGVQSSSDHISTHSSYACILVEDFTRQGLLDGMRRRHTYAATDQIVMDFRIEGTDSGTALMGDIVTSKQNPRLVARIIGTAPITDVEVIRSNQYIHKLSPNQQDVRLEYLDASPPMGESYYYVRAQQADGQLVWSSPIWIKR